METHTAVPLFDDEQWRSELATAIRPDGRVYRAIKPPVARVIEDPDGEQAIIVLRTHDLDRAHQLALKLASYVEGEIDSKEAFRTWLSDTFRNGERLYEFDHHRGCPAVWFEVC